MPLNNPFKQDKNTFAVFVPQQVWQTIFIRLSGRYTTGGYQCI